MNRQQLDTIPDHLLYPRKGASSTSIPTGSDTAAGR